MSGYGRATMPMPAAINSDRPQMDVEFSISDDMEICVYQVRNGDVDPQNSESIITHYFSEWYLDMLAKQIASEIAVKTKPNF